MQHYSEFSEAVLSGAVLLKLFHPADPQVIYLYFANTDYSKPGFLKWGSRPPLGTTERFTGNHELKPSLGSFVILYNDIAYCDITCCDIAYCDIEYCDIEYCDIA